MIAISKTKKPAKRNVYRSRCGRAALYRGDCLKVLPTLPENSVDSVVTDPPYGLRFMGKDWDNGVPGPHFWREVLRVAKPGAFLLCFGGTRTFHRLACAIEDAGWQIRDTLMWVYGQGFPKSLDISKAIDKAAGHWRGRRICPAGPGFFMGKHAEQTPKGHAICACCCCVFWLRDRPEAGLGADHPGHEAGRRHVFPQCASLGPGRPEHRPLPDRGRGPLAGDPETPEQQAQTVPPPRPIAWERWATAKRGRLPPPPPRRTDRPLPRQPHPQRQPGSSS